MQRRGDCALEVYLQGNGNRPVGWLTCFRVGDNLPARTNHIRLSTVAFIGEDEVEEERQFSLVKHYRVIDAYEMAMAKKRSLLLARIPRYAEEFSDGNSDEVRYEWRALKLTQEQFEFVFDHPSFEPADHSEPDIELKKQERFDDAMANIGRQMAQVITDAMLFGTGTTTATESSSESTLSVESFTAAMRKLNAA